MTRQHLATRRETLDTLDDLLHSIAMRARAGALPDGVDRERVLAYCETWVRADERKCIGRKLRQLLDAERHPHWDDDVYVLFERLCDDLNKGRLPRDEP